MPSTQENLKAIKRSFRLYMNGVVSASMRQKGADYKINWGVSLEHLREMSQEYGKDEELADALWKENIRECKILATLIMPSSAMNAEKAEEWLNDIRTQEMAELTAYHLFQYMDSAMQMAISWLDKDQPLQRICAFHVLSNQFKQSVQMNEQDEARFLQYVLRSLKSSNMSERHAAMNALNHFADIDDVHDKQAQDLLEKWETEMTENNDNLS